MRLSIRVHRRDPDTNKFEWHNPAITFTDPAIDPELGRTVYNNLIIDYKGIFGDEEGAQVLHHTEQHFLMVTPTKRIVVTLTDGKTPFPTIEGDVT